jgi:prepilin-type N-terminal cleavage/methylation domain-containing protein
VSLSTFTRRSKASQCGFTLIEVLISMAILSVSAAIILEHVKVLQRRALAVVRHQDQIRVTLNTAAELGRLDWQKAKVTTEAAGVRVTFTNPDDRVRDLFVTNYSTDKISVPVARGYSPYQIYRIDGEQGHALDLLLPSLSPAAAPK